MTCPPNAERRRTQQYMLPQSPRTPGIDRIVELAMRDVEQHDQSYGTRDSSEWQATYSLRNHMARVGMTMAKVGRHLGWSEHNVELGRVAGLLHDIGKLHELCQAYRLNRGLLPHEKALVDRHAAMSGNHVRGLKRYVRPEDRPFIDKVSVVVDCHHKGYHLRDPELRIIAYSVKTVDSWVGIQEDRDRPGLGPGQANEWLESLDFVRQEKDEYHKPHLWIIQDCKQAIFDLFGLNLHREE